MEGSLRSGEVLKKKSSSGCLIIKKKRENSNIVGLGGLNNNKGNKRPRAVFSDSGSSDENQSLEHMRRKVNEKKFRSGSLEDGKNGRRGREYHGNNGGREMGGEMKRNRLDLFEFDEYDEFDEKQIRNEYVQDSFKMVGHSENFKEIGGGSSIGNVMEDKRNHDSFLGSSSGKRKGIEYCGRRNTERLVLEEDEGHMPISLLRLKYQEAADEPIRLQGKNGVLKVMVNKKKKMDFPPQHKNYQPQEVTDRKESRSETVVKKDVVGPSLASVPKQHKKGLPFDKEKRVEKERMDLQVDKAKLSTRKSSEARGSQVDETDTSLELALPGMQSGRSKKVAEDEERSPPPKDLTSSKGKDDKAKRGGSTEKQMLRDKIRKMLIDSGWTIDYRPRRNRDYLDAVYINPSGTAYWSIIKAYDALKKQLEEGDGKSKSDVGSSAMFSPLSEDLINKLTRQTKKKLQKELKRKRKEDRTNKTAKKSAMKRVAESSDSDQSEENLRSYRKEKCKSVKDKLHEVDQDSGGDESDDLPKRKTKKDRVENHNTTNSNAIQGRTSKIIGRCTLLIRNSNKGQNSESDGYVTYTGKRTVLAWLIDSGIAQLSEKVQYMNRRRTRVLLEGWITRDGIHCGCCSKILTVSKFELHAGSKLRQPFHNIVLESGASLLQCQIDAWNKQEESVRQSFHTVDVDGDDPDDDTCGICGDGGDLICCDSCPSTFHQSCLDIQMLPPGDWHCPKCICRFCGDVSRIISEENNTTVDILQCILCEKKYHKLCSEMENVVPMSSHGQSHSFCGKKCQELHDHLQKFVGVKHDVDAGYSWSLIQRTVLESDTLLRGFPQRVECNSKLAVALSIMDECFLPIVDRRSGTNIIRNVVYSCGSNFNRLDYHGFYTAILERGDEIISAASIRIRGNYLAEMPFIGTREIYRRQGMCRRLLSAIESTLCTLKVEKLIIPAISEHMNTWTVVFGFHHLEDAHKKEMKSLNMLVFPGTDMLQKQLVKPEISDGIEVLKLKENKPHSCVLVEKSDSDSTIKQNRKAGDDAGVCDEIKIHNKVDAVDSDSPVSVVPSSDNPVASAFDATLESDDLVSSNGATSIKSEAEKKLKEHSTTLKFPSSSADKVDAVESDSPASAVPSSDSTMASAFDATRESDDLVCSNGKTAINSVAEKKLKESSTSLKCPSSSADEVDAMDSDSPASAVPSNDNTMASALDVTRESDNLVYSNGTKSSTSLKLPSSAVKKVDAGDSDSPASAVPSNDNTMASAFDATHESDDLVSTNGTTAIKSEEEKKCNKSSTTSFKCPSSSSGKIDAVESDSLASAVPPNDNTVTSALDSTLEPEDLVSSNGTTAVKSVAEKKLKESSACLNCPSCSPTDNDFSEVKNRLLDHPAKDNPQSSVDLVIGIECKIRSNAPCLESVPDTSCETVNMSDKAVESDNPVSVSGIFRVDKHAMDSTPGLDDHNVVEIQGKVGAASEFSLEEKVAIDQGDIGSTVEVSHDANPEINVKEGFIESTCGSLFDTSAQSTTERVEQSSANLHGVDVESQLHSSIELSTDTVGAADVEVSLKGGSTDPSAFSDTNTVASCTKETVEVSVVKPAFGGSLDISAQAAKEGIKENQDNPSLSNFQGSCENSMRCNTDSNQKVVLEAESDIMASKVIQGKVVDPVE